MAILNFDARTVNPDTSFEPVPAGWYNLMIDESEMKPTNDGTGAYLALGFKILDGQYAGRKLFARLNLQNSNPTAVEIAYKTLSSIAHAVGVLQVQDSAQLHGIPLKGKVKIRPAKGEYEASNDFSGFKNINEVTGAEAGSGVPAGFGGGVPAGFGAAQPQQAQGMPAGFPGAATQQPQPTYQQPQPVAQTQPAAQPWNQGAAQPWNQGGVDPNAAGAYSAQPQTQPAAAVQPVAQPQPTVDPAQAWQNGQPTQPWQNGQPQQAAQPAQQPAYAPNPETQITQQQQQQAQTATPPWQTQEVQQQAAMQQGTATPPWQQPQQ